ncbi:MAG: hypothetical protein NTZ33_12715 [Bacteroidetes bacterium]|nr:hypothetical protein [Bacteroidota bacterium]
MNSIFLTFVKKLIIFSIIISCVVIAAYFLLPPKIISPALLFLLPYFFAITLLTYYFQLKAVHKTFIKFTNIFMLITIIKLLILMSVLILYILINRTDAIPFLAWYFLLYVCFTAFETIYFQKVND